MTEESPKKNSGGRLFRFRNLCGIACAFFLLFWPWTRSEVQIEAIVLGCSLVALGVSLRLWSILQIGGAARKSTLKAVHLITWGPFSLVRNPIYIANMTVFAGFTTLAGFLWLAPVLVFALLIWYTLQIRREENFLEGKFPQEFADYAHSTGRWLPGWQFHRRPDDVPAYPFTRALRRERGHLFLVASGMVIFLFLAPLLRSQL